MQTHATTMDDRTGCPGKRPRSKASASDTPAIARRRAREMRTVSQMIGLYCAGHHECSTATQVSFAGEAICPACKELDEYCVKRTERCRSMATKTSCDKCGNHCYAPAQQERIRQVMRYAGPRMLTKHPIAAIRHLLGK